MAAEHLQLLRFACTAVGLVSLLGPGSVFFRGAWYAIRARTPHMDLPVALGWESVQPVESGIRWQVTESCIMTRYRCSSSCC